MTKTKRKILLVLPGIVCLLAAFAALASCAPGNDGGQTSLSGGTQSSGSGSSGRPDVPGGDVEEYYTEGLLFEASGENYYVSGYEGSDTEVVVPSVYRGAAVTGVRDTAFAYNAAVEKVTLADSITDIGTWTFSDCTALREVVLSDSLTSIPDWAFSGCTALETVILPETPVSFSV